MITPTPVATQITAKVNAADLATLKAAIAASNVIALPEGKTLDNVPMFTLRQLPAVQADGTAAIITGQLN